MVCPHKLTKVESVIQFDTRHFEHLGSIDTWDCKGSSLKPFANCYMSLSCLQFSLNCDKLKQFHVTLWFHHTKLKLGGGGQLVNWKPTILAIKDGTLDTPLNQCCNQTWYAMQFARHSHSNTTLKGGEGRMEIEYLKKPKKLSYVQVSQLFLSKIVVHLPLY